MKECQMFQKNLLSTKKQSQKAFESSHHSDFDQMAYHSTKKQKGQMQRQKGIKLDYTVPQFK